MHLIKVNAINSTNSFGREFFKENPGMPLTCISARHQLSGRGQRGTSWSAQAGLNLTFSVVFPNPPISLSHTFLISAAAATGVVQVLKSCNIPKLRLKWPNDIMTANKKLGGILIENVITEGRLSASVIGIGLNVNQTQFEELPNATSLKLAAGRGYELDSLLVELTDAIEAALKDLRDQSAEEVMGRYKKQLFRKGVASTFRLPDQSLLTGIIDDVRLDGRLVVRTEDEEVREYDIKEIQLCL